MNDDVQQQNPMTDSQVQQTGLQPSGDNQATASVANVQTSVDGNVQTKQVGRYKVEVIRDKCISAGSCEAIAPNVFQLDEEGIATVISQDGNTDDEKLLAAQSCPTSAIIVTDTQTGEQVWPKV